MSRIEKTVFISYRRTDVYTALAVYENLKNQGYDVFFDYRSISSGDFEQIITSNISARAHFLLLLTPTALDRCSEPGDWLRREIEFAIDEKRNIIPLFFRGFRFGDPTVTEKLTGKLRNISRYNGLNVHEDYFDEAMHRLRTQYLNIPLNTVLHPVSTEVRKVVREEQIAADEALEHIENVKELVKQNEKKQKSPRAKTSPKRKTHVPAETSSLSEKVEDKSSVGLPNVTAKPQHMPSLKSITSQKTIKQAIGGYSAQIRWIAGGIIFAILLLWAGTSLFQNQLPSAPTSNPTSNSSIVATQTSRPLTTSTPPPTLTSAPPAPTLGIGSSMSGADGMTLLYVPGGEFMMGAMAVDAVADCQKYRSNCLLSSFENAEPPHEVYLDPFWIDKNEVTNQMYSLCVTADICKAPSSYSSETHPSYYGNGEFSNYPVINISWNMARTYCEWANRRLPTEAEWEKAARGTDNRSYPWGNDVPNADLLNFNSEIGDTTEVGRYPNGASPYGALDMAGNVWEWVADWYADSYYRDSPSANPPGPPTGANRTLRGGTWLIFDQGVQSAKRSTGSPDDTNTYNFVGFRCAMSATQ